MNLSLILHSNIIHGVGELNNLAKHVKDLGLVNTGIICDKNLYQNSAYVSKVVKNFIMNSEFLFFYDSPFEPSYQYIDKLMETVRITKLDKKIDSWVAIGGGSVMDTAKALAILCRNEGESIKFKGFPKKLNEPLPVIAVPSTTGTGSEVVFNASFIVEKNKVKMGINYEKNYPVLSILDPLVVSSAPISVLISSGCDALVHALEGFVSTKSNPHTRSFSAHAFKLIIQNMPIILSGKGNLEHWSNMQWAAVFAMYGLSNSTSGPTGALSYYLGTHFKVPHGIAGALFIGKVTRHNHDNGYHDYAQLYHWKENGLPDKDKSNIVVEKIEKLLNQTGIPLDLKNYGVQEDDYPSFMEFCKQAQAAFNFNPIEINENQIYTLLQ